MDFQHFTCHAVQLADHRPWGITKSRSVLMLLSSVEIRDFLNQGDGLDVRGVEISTSLSDLSA